MKMVKLRFMLLVLNQVKIEGELMPIETDEEWDMIEEMLATFMAEDEE